MGDYFKRSNANLIYRLWTSNNAFHSASISWWRMSTGTWNLRIATDSLKTWQHLDVISDWSNSSLEPAISLKEVFLHDVNTPVTFFLGTTILWVENGLPWIGWRWWVLLMHVVVKAAVNCIACHFNQKWWMVEIVSFVFFFYLCCIPFECTSKLMLEQGQLFAQVDRWVAVIPQI